MNDKLSVACDSIPYSKWGRRIIKRSPYILVLFFFMGMLVGCGEDTPVPEEAIFSISPGSVTIEADNPYLTSLQLLRNNEPADTSGVVWKSMDEQIVVFFSKGVLDGKWAGQTEVVAYSQDGTALARASVTVTDKRSYKLRLTLKDKGVEEAEALLGNPERFLSPESVDRRRRQGIGIDESDLPLSEDYLREITAIGGVIVAKSKWLGTVSVHCEDGSLLDKYRALPFVEEVQVVWRRNRADSERPHNPWSFPGSHVMSAPQLAIGKDTAVYGPAYGNLAPHWGQFLHQKGYKGKGKRIAVIDAGYKDVDRNPVLDNVHLLGAKSFIYERPDPFAADDHGVLVLSCMAGAKPSQFIGAAPESSYLLLTTEDQFDEYPIEEDYYVSALEYADSVGVDIVNSSLHYKEFYLPGTTYSYESLDGKTAYASRGANMATAKGILVVTAAGNNGDFVGTPADALDVLAVGMVNRFGEISGMSARGITTDGRMKPDIVGLGIGVYLVAPDGAIKTSLGTSFASPLVAGMAACLWQAFPHLTNRQVARAIRQSADRYTSPALPYGNGIPDMQKAYELADRMN